MLGIPIHELGIDLPVNDGLEIDLQAKEGLGIDLPVNDGLEIDLPAIHGLGIDLEAKEGLGIDLEAVEVGEEVIPRKGQEFDLILRRKNLPL